jgi:hypothetical protein
MKRYEIKYRYNKADRHFGTMYIFAENKKKAIDKFRKEYNHSKAEYNIICVEEIK